jgi:adenylate kinase family enzyme
MLKFTDFITEQADLDEGIHDPARRKAIFLAGGPGSGKSYVSKATTQGLGFKHVNSDDLFEKGLEKAGLEKTPENIYSPQGQSIRDRAKKSTAGREAQWAKGRLGLVIDGTGKDPDKIKAHSEKLRKMGYDTHMVFVNTSLETAQARNRQRDRTLPDDVVAQMHAQVQGNIGHFQQHFGSENMHVVDNDYADEMALHHVHKKIRAIASAPVRNPIGKREDKMLGVKPGKKRF